MQAVASSFFRFRAAIVPPAAATGWAIAYATGAPAGQLRAMAVGMLVTSLFFVYEARRARAAMSDRRLLASLVLTLALLAMGAMATGAIASPMLSLLFAPTLTAFAAWGRRRRESIAVLVAFVVVLAALFVARERAPFAELSIASRAPMAALLSLVTALLLWSSVAGLADAYTSAAREVGRLREDAVQRVIERSKALDAVGATVAHEIKNPLAAIKGLVQLLARDERAEREARRLSVIEGEVARIERVLASYLAFARPLDALKLERASLRSIVEGVIATLEPRASRAGVTFERDVLDVELRVDRAKVEAALINVLLNAIEASPSGGVVRVRCARDESGAAVLTVRDEGRGMSERTLARVGTAFFTTRPDGTGLGVVVARGAIEQHGGRLELSSIEGAGTVVSVTLPLDPTSSLTEHEVEAR